MAGAVAVCIRMQDELDIQAAAQDGISFLRSGFIVRKVRSEALEIPEKRQIL